VSWNAGAERQNPPQTGDAAGCDELGFHSDRNTVIAQVDNSWRRFSDSIPVSVRSYAFSANAIATSAWETGFKPVHK
jgi:hypothetical protein